MNKEIPVNPTCLNRFIDRIYSYNISFDIIAEDCLFKQRLMNGLTDIEIEILQTRYGLSFGDYIKPISFVCQKYHISETAYMEIERKAFQNLRTSQDETDEDYDEF